MKKSVSVHDEDAVTYDQQTLNYEYFAPDAIFGMCYEFINPGEKLLDIGIGTGLSSRLFARAGLKVYGVDGSEQMLEACQVKGFAYDLKCVDITETPWPYADRYFPYIISSGLLHFFSELDFAVKEVSRIIKTNGIFAFTIAVPPEKTDSSEGIYDKIDTEWGVPVFAHKSVYIDAILEKYGFKLLKKQRLIMKGGTNTENSLLFAIYIVKSGNS
ncbi:MAG: class I SAM-dependent methyltransferase [Calditrichaceae bacterium]|nr:class I SAM-dependent methyltransferase [Calditrichaceae bacterium]RQV93867.1 MAG: class I SAM-dependent methyltransferase [Calditrichota bacterium]